MENKSREEVKDAEMEVLLKERVTLQLCQGDITREDKVDAITNAANEYLSHSAGLAKAIVDRGGEQIEIESKEYIKANKRVPKGEVVVTSPGFLQCNFILHAIGPYYHEEQKYQAIIDLHQCVRKTLDKANEYQCSSIAIPPISAGIYGFPVELCAKTIMEAIEEFAESSKFLRENHHLKKVKIVIIDAQTFEPFKKEFTRRYTVYKRHQVELQAIPEVKRFGPYKESVDQEVDLLSDLVPIDKTVYQDAIERLKESEQNIDKIECEHCHKQILLDYIDHHETYECSEKAVTCRKCGVDIPQSLLNEHNAVCESYKNFGGSHSSPKRNDNHGSATSICEKCGIELQLSEIKDHEIAHKIDDVYQNNGSSNKRQTQSHISQAQQQQQMPPPQQFSNNNVQQYSNNNIQQMYPDIGQYGDYSYQQQPLSQQQHFAQYYQDQVQQQPYNQNQFLPADQIQDSETHLMQAQQQQKAGLMNSIKSIFGIKPKEDKPKQDNNAIPFNLPQRQFQAQNNKPQQCIVCQEKFEVDEIVTTLKCFHEFHSDCIGDWFKKGKTECPICKQDQRK